MPAPRLTPYPEQLADAGAIASNPATLLALPMGMGKSLIAVEAAMYMDAERVFIVAPKNTFRSWEKMVRRQYQTDQPFFFQRIDNSALGKSALADLMNSNKPGFYIVSWEYLRTRPVGYWNNISVDFVILDEVHRMQNRKGKTWKNVQKINAPYKLAMSGTPNGNKMMGFWTVLRWLWPTQTPLSFWRWAHQWLVVTKNPVLGFTEVKGEQNPGALLASQPHYIWRPDTQTHLVADIEIEAPLKPAQRKLYRDLERDMVVFLENNPLTVEIPLHMRMRLRSITLGVPYITEDGKLSYHTDTDSTKLDGLLEFMGDLPEGETVLVFTHSRDFALVTAIRLYEAGYPAYAWVGGTSQSERDKVVDKWGDTGGVQVIVAVVEAIAEGTDGLQDKCHTEYWLSESENPLINNQARSRLPRDGQKHTVTRARAISPGTYDEKIIAKQVQLQIDLNKSYAGKTTKEETP